MDANDESLKRWKESLGINASGAPAAAEGPKVRSLCRAENVTELEGAYV